MKQIRVNLKERSYNVTIGPGASSLLRSGLKKIFQSRQLVVLTDRRVARLHRSRLEKILKKSFKTSWIVIPDGEREKNLQRVSRIYRDMVRNGITRNSALIAFGGGVVGDIGGFVAATYLRGIPFIQLPTTLVAQVDSSVGGKTGVNLPEGKNLVGVFYQPRWVVIDTHFLKTLPTGKFRCGLAEVIKTAIIGDEKLFTFLEKNVGKISRLNDNALVFIVERSVRVKASIVSRDEKEGGLRAVLNLGHTLGHAIETIGRYSAHDHGEGVAIGLAYAALLSLKKGLCFKQTTGRIVSLLERFRLPVQQPGYSRRRIARAMASDKKGNGAVIRYIAIRRIGTVIPVPLTIREITRWI